MELGAGHNVIVARLLPSKIGLNSRVLNVTKVDGKLTNTRHIRRRLDPRQRTLPDQSHSRLRLRALTAFI
jgi:hypothetical protein